MRYLRPTDRHPRKQQQRPQMPVAAGRGRRTTESWLGIVRMARRSAAVGLIFFVSDRFGSEGQMDRQSPARSVLSVCRSALQPAIS
jgi:hypothetical protein